MQSALTDARDHVYEMTEKEIDVLFWKIWFKKNKYSLFLQIVEYRGLLVSSSLFKQVVVIRPPKVLLFYFLITSIDWGKITDFGGERS